MQLDDVSGDKGEGEGSKTEKFSSREEVGREGGEISADPLSKVMMWPRWTWLACRNR